VTAVIASPSPTDVLIIGAGASGAIAARTLVGAGLRVTCLEQGDWVSREDFPGKLRDWEFMSQKDWHPNPNYRDQPADYPLDTSESDVNPLMYNAVGGSTILYGGQWMRMVPSDFRVRTLDGVADDWPINYWDLLPYYEEVDRVMGISGTPGDPAYPPGAPPPLPQLPIGKIGMKAAEGMNKLGWHWWPGTNAIASREYGRLHACVLRGVCVTGCPEGAKATVDITLWRDAIARGARLVVGARVREITSNAKGLATGAIYLDRNGAEHKVSSSVVVMAANGVGTARLLLLSASKRSPKGLANSSGLVGRRFMMHPVGSTVGYFDEPLESWVGPLGQSITSLEFYETDISRGFVRGAKWEVNANGGPLGTRAGYAGSPVDDSLFGSRRQEQVRRTLGRSIEWCVTCEDLPEEKNRVTLSDDLTDADGIPAPAIQYRVAANTERMLAFHTARQTEALQAAGAIRIDVAPLVRDSGYHLLGTARMGIGPESSVVNEWCQSHDVPNLLVIDGSVFVTASGMNPTATIMAIALRAMNHLLEGRGLLRVPL
jgi:choline dehydrogenase-like flavoprotein